MTPKPKLLQLPIPPPIETPEQALNWAEETVSACEKARKACDIPLDAMKTTTIRELRRRESTYLIRHGQALGVVLTLMRTGKISAEAYNGFVTRVQKTLVASAAAIIGQS